MEHQAFSMTYLHEGKELTAVLYAPSQAAAEQAFRSSFHASKALVKAEAVTDWAPSDRPKTLIP